MTERLQTYLREIGEKPERVHAREIGDDLCVIAKPLLFHWTIILCDMKDRLGYLDRWCFEGEGIARRAVDAWPVPTPEGYEPNGWHRHPATGRRRVMGLRETEYVDP